MSAAPDGERSVGLVTGGASGIGFETARRLGEAGARVITVDRNPSRSPEPVDGAGRQDVEAPESYAADVTDATAMREVVARVEERYGRLDFVVACAGIAEQSSIVSGDPQRWAAVVHTNIIGTMVTVQAAVPGMLALGRGQIVLLASTSGRETYAGEPAYIASKWGVVGFGHALRQEIEGRGVRVTLVEPGLVDTPLTQGNPAVDAMKEYLTPLTAADVARAVAFAIDQPPHVSIPEISLIPRGYGAERDPTG